MTKPQPNNNSQEQSGDLDSGFFCDLVGVTTAFGKDEDTSSDRPEPIDGTEDVERIDDGDIEESRTQVPPHKKGGVKMLMMFGLVAIPMSLLGFVLFGSSGTQEASTAAVQKPTETVTPAPKADFAADRRFSDMQSKLAMQSQQQSLLAAAKEQERERLEKEQSAKQAEVQPSKPVTTATTPSSPTTQPAEVSPPTNVEPPPQPVAVEPAIVPKPVTRKPVVAEAPIVKPQVTATPIVKVSTPIPARVALKPTVEPPPRVVTQIAPRFAPKPVSWQQAATGGSMVWTSKSAATTAQGIAANTTVSASSNQTTDRSARVLIPGQIRGVSLVTPIQVIAGEEAQDVLINLEQGFIDAAGTIAIPANSKVLAKISVAANGLVRIMDCTVIVGTKEYRIPAGAFTLSLPDNSPVIAQLKQFGGSEIGRRDLQTFLLGAAQGIGEALTQPTSTAQAIGPNGSFSATQNNPNVIGGLLKGGATPIVQQWLTRNQAEVARIEGMVRLWHLPSGQKLSLYAVKKIDLSN